MTRSRSVKLAYVIVVLIWATTPLAIRWGAVDTGFAFAAMARMVLGMLFALLLHALWRLHLPLHRRALLSYLCAGGGLAVIVVLLFAVLSHAASLVGLKWIADDSPPLATATGALLVAAPLFLLSWWLAGGSLPSTLSLRGGLSIVYLGLFGSVLGFALYYYIVRYLSSAQVALILVITPVLALLIGRLFNDEQLRSQVWLGAAVICSGLLLHQRGSRPAVAAVAASDP